MNENRRHFTIALASSVGVVAGFYPAWRATHMPPVIALNHN